VLKEVKEKVEELKIAEEPRRTLEEAKSEEANSEN
jgi:hypothetical protein